MNKIPDLYAVVAIIFDSTTKKILLSERTAQQTYHGYWEFPGGKIEDSENPEQTLVRELQEELDIIVQSFSFIQSYTHDYPDRRVNLQVYKVEQYHNQPKGIEGQKLCWFSIEEIYTLSPKLPGMIELITAANL